MTERGWEQLRVGLRALAGEMKGREAPGHLESALRAGFRRRRATEAWRRRIAVGAIAASLCLLAVSSALMLTRPPQIATAPVAPAREVFTQFMPVMGGDVMEPFERGRLVRVQLPRSALASFGLPVNAERFGESVKAEVVLGEDGLAKAIRFVQ